MQLLSSSDDEKEKEKERKRLIAKQIINETNFSPQKPKKIEKIEDIKGTETIPNLSTNVLHSQRLQRTQKIISDKRYNEIYTMQIERASETNLKLQKVLSDVKKQSVLKSNLKKVVGVLRSSLKVSRGETMIMILVVFTVMAVQMLVIRVEVIVLLVIILAVTLSVVVIIIIKVVTVIMILE